MAFALRLLLQWMHDRSLQLFLVDGIKNYLGSCALNIKIIKLFQKANMNGEPVVVCNM